jgi:hypothetical protein
VKDTDCHDAGTEGAMADARALARGEGINVLMMRWAMEPSAVTSTPREGA